ncbi:unnamed protein product, partial [Laminaria digitata]
RTRQADSSSSSIVYVSLSSAYPASSSRRGSRFVPGVDRRFHARCRFETSALSSRVEEEETAEQQQQQQVREHQVAITPAALMAAAEQEGEEEGKGTVHRSRG